MFVEKTSSDNSQKLKIKRESMGLSLEDVFMKIRIRSSYLQAIENGEFNLLPDTVYTKNFIKTYSKFLGVDEGPILKDFDNYFKDRKEELMPPPEVPPEEKPFFASVASKKNYWGIFFVLIIIFVIWMILKQNAPVTDELTSSGNIDVPVAEINDQNVNSSPNATATENQQIPADSLPKINEAEKSLEQPANIVDPVQKNVSLPLETKQVNSGVTQKSTLYIMAGQETWIRIKPGEDPPFQVLLKPGEKFESNAETFYLDIGNAGGIKIQYKGKLIENLGGSGEVVHIRLPQL